MKRKTVKFILLFVLIGTNICYSYNEYVAEKNFYRIKEVLIEANSIPIVLDKIDSLKQTFKDQINNRIILSFNRDVDFGYRHKRILVLFEHFQYQIDLLSQNDTIYLKSLRTEYFKKLTFENLDTNYLKDYLEMRNAFYGSKKMIKNLVLEISNDEFFAIRCGDASELTHFGKKVYKYSKRLRYKKLNKLLGNFNCEIQSFGVAGFEMTKERNKKIPIKYELLINHIKERNSELTTCSGSLIGLIEKIY